jgi:PKD repeat protein
MKNIKIALLALLLSFLGASLFSQETTATVDNVFAGKKEIYFKFSVSARQEINDISRIISVQKVTNSIEVYAYANRKEFAKFLEHHYSYTLLPYPGVSNPQMCDEKNIKQILTAWNAYPTYSAYEAMMYQYAANYPSICQVYNIKTLASGRKLLVAKISHDVTVHENKPQFLYTSTMHGNEPSGYIHMLHLIDTLLSNYGTNARITNILDNIELWINPLANPDGTYGASGGASISGAVRYNANGVDLNRNYPDPSTDSLHPDGNAWQPETMAFMELADTLNFVMSANFHEGDEVCNYPWDGKPGLTADNNWWQYVSKQFADTAQTFGPSGFFTDITSTGIIDGYAWYQVLGGRQDFMNYYRHCREETVEISETQCPAGSQLPVLWKSCKRSFFNYLEQSLKGIRGIVTDSCTGKGIRALVTISGHDIDSSQIYSALPVGNYHRLIYTGTYNLTFSATGYHSKTINNISVTNGNTVVRNVILKPLVIEVPLAGYTDSYSGPTVNFINTSSNGITYLWNFGDGDTSTLVNPSHTYTSSGTYTVQLIAINNCGSDTITHQINDYAGINEVPSNKSIAIYPNPANNECTITINSWQSEAADISIYNIVGNIVYSSSIALNSGNNNIKVNTRDYIEGVYFIRIKTNSCNFTTKLIKVKE